MRAYHGLDPMRFKQSRLVLYFRLDDSGGRYYTNTAMYKISETTATQYIYHATDIQWYFYSDLSANATTDSETMKSDLFCRAPYQRRLNKHCDNYGGCDTACALNECVGPKPD